MEILVVGAGVLTLGGLSALYFYHYAKGPTIRREIERRRQEDGAKARLDLLNRIND